MLSPSSYTFACINWITYTYIPIGLDLWVVMLSHAVIRVIQVFPSYMMLSLACVFMSVWSPIRRDVT
jgi:hypothetical protein